MNFFIISELYPPLTPWLYEDRVPKGMPAVYNLFQHLGHSEEHQFYSIIVNREQNRTLHFPNGSRIELIRFRFPFYYAWKLLVFFYLFLVGARVLRREKFDVVYGLSTFSTVASILGKRFGVFSVSRIYGTILTDPVKKRQYFKLYTRYLFDILAIRYASDLLLCTQDGTQFDRVVHFFDSRKRVDFLYNGMERQLKRRLLQIPLVERLPDDAELRICYIARLFPYKRQWLGIALVEELVRRHGLRVRLNILGTGPEEAGLRKMVADKGLMDCVYFIPEMPQDQLPDFVARHHLSLFFYIGGSLGNTMWENALAGRLICTIDNGGTAEVFEDQVNALIAADEADFPVVMAQKIAAWVGKDVSAITGAGRDLVDGIILDWEKRFARELALIEARKTQQRKLHLHV
ncbi:MAG: glycosyltransferase [Bacteroidota bacterium]